MQSIELQALYERLVVLDLLIVGSAVDVCCGEVGNKKKCFYLTQVFM